MTFVVNCRVPIACNSAVCHWPLASWRCKKGCTTCAKCFWHAANRFTGNIAIKTYACCTQQGQQQQSNSHNNHEQIACCMLHVSTAAWRDISPWRGIETCQQHSGSASRMLGAIWRFRLLRKYTEAELPLCRAVRSAQPFTKNISIFIVLCQHTHTCARICTHRHNDCACTCICKCMKWKWLHIFAPEVFANCNVAERNCGKYFVD